MPIFDKSELVTILQCGVEQQAASGYLKKIKIKLEQELLRCILKCPESHLARIACGIQPMGVAFSADNTDFKIIFMSDGLNGLYDPWDTKAVERVTLPEMAPLSESGDTSEVVDMAVAVAGISRRQRTRLQEFQLFTEETPDAGYLELLMLNPRVTESLRAQVMENMSRTYVPQLDACPEEIYVALQDRLDDEKWEQERRAARGKPATN